MALLTLSSCSYNSISIKLVYVLLWLCCALVKSQEAPLYYVPKWSTNVSHQTDFCALHEAVENGEIERRNALRGLELSVLFIDYQLQSIGEDNFRIDPGNPNIAMDMLDEIAYMGGFTYRNSYAVVESPTANETWTELLYWGVEVYDIMGEWFVESVERLSAGNVLFPEGWYDGNFILVQRQVQDNDDNASVFTMDLFAWTTPFTPALWGLIGATTIFSGFVYYILDYFDSCIYRKPMDVTLEESIFYSAFSFNGHYTHQPKSRGTRILVFSMAFFFLIIVAAYTANLASFLVSRNRPQIEINSIQDAIRHELTICVQGSAATDEHLQTYRIPQSRIVRAPSSPASFTDLLEGRCNVLFTTMGEFESSRRDAALNPYCDLEHVGRIVKFESAGFVVGDSERHCTSLLRDVLHLFILEMKNNPTFDVIWQQYREKEATAGCTNMDGDDEESEEENSDSMGISNLSGMFVLHFCALAVALLSTFLNFCSQPYERKRKMTYDLWAWIRGNRPLERVSFTSGWLSKRFSRASGSASSAAVVVAATRTNQKNKKSTYVVEDINLEQQNDYLENHHHHHVENETIMTSTVSSSQQSQQQHPPTALLLQMFRDERECMQKERESMQKLLLQNNVQHQEEIRQIHEYYRDEMEHCHKEHRIEMERFYWQHPKEGVNNETTTTRTTKQPPSKTFIASKTLGAYDF